MPYVGLEANLLPADGSSPAPLGVEGFGKCLLQAIEGMLALGHEAACVLSSDCPSLPTNLLSEAANILLESGDRVVLGETHDGGYYLLGLKASHTHLFRNVSWSTSSVSEETRARAGEIGLELKELGSWYDVDDASSLRTLIEDSGGYVAPKSRQTIHRLGLHRLPELQRAA